MPQAELITDQERRHLRRALELAEHGRGRVSPNPLVGALLVRGGAVIGAGFHAELGGPHAEVAAIEDCRARGADPTGATMYVTLEPCAHHGRQPPCTDAIVAAGIARIVIASDDPSEKASGRGPGALRDEGIEVVLTDGAEAAAARMLNQAFRKHARTGRPLVVFKSALSLDGKVATVGGESKWISGADSRALVHRWRADVDAVAVGIETALADDPLLTARDVEAEASPVRQPARVIFDSQARLALDAALVASVDEGRVILIAGPAAPVDRTQPLQDSGVELIVVDGTGPSQVAAALAELGRREITSLLLEGGPTLAGAFLDAGEVDELRFFIAPIVLGGRGARAVIEGEGAAGIAQAQRALATDWDRVGDDLLLTARLKEW